MYRVYLPTCDRNSATSDADFREFFIPRIAFVLLTVTTLLPVICTVNIPKIGVITLIVSKILDQRCRKFQEIPARDCWLRSFSENNSSPEYIKCTRGSNNFCNMISCSFILPPCAIHSLVATTTLRCNKILLFRC